MPAKRQPRRLKAYIAAPGFAGKTLYRNYIRSKAPADPRHTVNPYKERTP